jgi:hypothetical protein
MTVHSSGEDRAVSLSALHTCVIVVHSTPVCLERRASQRDQVPACSFDVTKWKPASDKAPSRRASKIFCTISIGISSKNVRVPARGWGSSVVKVETLTGPGTGELRSMCETTPGKRGDERATECIPNARVCWPTVGDCGSGTRICRYNGRTEPGRGRDLVRLWLFLLPSPHCQRP